MNKKPITQGRTAGVLMSVASLPSREGIGTFGKGAYKFVDMLVQMGVGVWQILPLNPLGYGNSPYQPFSSYAGDELYIDLELLWQKGYLSRRPEACENTGRIDYEAAKAYKAPCLREACVNFLAAHRNDPEFLEFQKMDWVYPYAVFIALKKQNGLRCWNEWPADQRDWIVNREYDVSHLTDEIEYQIFVQYQFYTQWMDLKSYANEKGVQIMGDIPIYVGIDSLDVWASREDFLLDEAYRPSFVAGVPPDYFSTTGQRWGNPIYNWEILQNKGFTFWVNRLKYSSTLYDIVRIDHFRAFDTYWKIPASCPTAVEGEWVEAPGYALFEEIFRRMPDIQIVAEDLGELRPEVLELRDHFGLLGMNIAQFSLPGNDQVQQHQLVYTGTHDNQTVKGWYQALSAGQKRKVRYVLAKYSPSGESVPGKMVRFVYGSAACLAIVPVSDLLGLGDEARLNTPGTVGSPNWEWRMKDWKRLSRKKTFVREILASAGRISTE